MILVQVEITNIEWENDESNDIEYDIGTEISFILELPDYELTSGEIDNAIRDTVESKTGHRPLH